MREFKPSVHPETLVTQQLAAEIEAREPIMSQGQSKRAGERIRDQIAEDMWKSYQNIMRSRRFPEVG